MNVKIIAELCQNHLGDFEMVKQMVDKAVDAGATHVKIQHIYTYNLVFRPQFEEGLTKDGKVLSIKRPWQEEYNRLNGLELTEDHCRKFVEYVKNKGAIPLTTCFARGDIKKIKEQGFEIVKVASYDCASYQMLRELSENFDELIISTGATFNDEIKLSAKLLGEKNKYSFLHCVTIYPTPLDQLHLARINWLKQFCPSIGFSDHSLVSRDGIVASKAAIALGAEIIERHFSLLGEKETKDGPVSITPGDIRELVRFARLDNENQREELDKSIPGWKELMSGNPERDLTEAELLNRDYYRGRFATPRKQERYSASEMIFNWEETPVW